MTVSFINWAHQAPIAPDPKVPGKPHIAVIGGYWRISPSKACMYYMGGFARWNKAFDFVLQLNKERFKNEF